jgi:hypothetical protein
MRMAEFLFVNACREAGGTYVGTRRNFDLNFGEKST